MARYLWLIVVTLMSFSMTHSAIAQTRKATDLPWELKFEYSMAARIVVQSPYHNAPVAYWYLPYKVTNNTKQEQMFLPVFELVGEDGKIRRSDKDTPQEVIDAIRKQAGNKFIQSTTQAAGELRLGPSEARYAVAVWPEPALKMGQFSILVAGLSGEYQQTKSPAGNEIIIRKTLQLTFKVRGDEVYPGEDEITELPSTWIMR